MTFEFYLGSVLLTVDEFFKMATDVGRKDLTKAMLSDDASKLSFDQLVLFDDNPIHTLSEWFSITRGWHNAKDISGSVKFYNDKYNIHKKNMMDIAYKMNPAPDKEFDKNRI